MVTKPSLGSFTLVLSVSATTTLIRSASLAARAVLFGMAPLLSAPVPGPDPADLRSSVVVFVAMDSAVDGQHLELGPPGHRPLTVIQQLNHPSVRACHDGDAQNRA